MSRRPTRTSTASATTAEEPLAPPGDRRLRRTPAGRCRFLMKAGSADRITEFDTGTFRDLWRPLKSRYGL